MGRDLEEVISRKLTHSKKRFVRRVFNHDEAAPESDQRHWLSNSIHYPSEAPPRCSYERLIAEVAARNGIRIDPADPAFALVTFVELVLEES